MESGVAGMMGEEKEPRQKTYISARVEALCAVAGM